VTGKKKSDSIKIGKNCFSMKISLRIHLTTLTQILVPVHFCLLYNVIGKGSNPTSNTFKSTSARL
jgi:hypothetical protein